MATQDNTIYLTDIDQLRLRVLSRTLLERNNGSREPGEELLDLVENAEVVPARAIAPDVVTMNSSVVAEGNMLGKGEHTLTLVYPDRADGATRRISVLSPLGRALLGARAGQTLEIQTPEGVHKLKLLRVVYQPEADGSDV